MLDIGCWMFNLDVGCLIWMLDVGCGLDIGPAPCALSARWSRFVKSKMSAL